MSTKPAAVLEEALIALKSRINGVCDAPEETHTAAEQLRADAATTDIVASQWRIATVHGNEPAVFAGDRMVLTADKLRGDDIDRIVACVNACRCIPTEELAGAQFVPADDETPLFELVPGGWENVQ